MIERRIKKPTTKMMIHQNIEICTPWKARHRNRASGSERSRGGRPAALAHVLLTIDGQNAIDGRRDAGVVILGLKLRFHLRCECRWSRPP